MITASGSINFSQSNSSTKVDAEKIRQQTRIETLTEDETKKQLDREKNRLKLEKVTQRSKEKLFQTRTVFPFTIFPHDVVIDRDKVSIIYRTFFWSKHIHSVIYEDVADIEVSTIPFFATLVIYDKGYKDPEIRVPWLWKDQAVKARRIIQGLVIAHQQKINLNSFPATELAQKIEELGKARDNS